MQWENNCVEIALRDWVGKHLRICFIDLMKHFYNFTKDDCLMKVIQMSNNRNVLIQ